MVQLVRSLAFAIVALTLAAGIAPAEDRRQNQPGRFDFYVLAMSWSPTFCAEARERGTPPQQQCGLQPFSFVVHGLWPQFERGFPEFCQLPPPRLDRDIVPSMLDIMPSAQLILHEWETHGTCSGLAPRAFFGAVRRMREQVKIPENYVGPRRALNVTPDDVERAFVTANPGLTRGAIAVTCDRTRLSEVRVCLSKDFRFRECQEVDRGACRRDRVLMPPVSGGR